MGLATSNPLIPPSHSVPHMTRFALAFAAASLLALPAFAQDAATVGQPAPAFELPARDGSTVSLSDFAGKVVVLEWTNPDCPYVVRHYDADTMENLATTWGDDVVWLAIDSSHFITAEAANSWAEAEGFAFPTLLDPTGQVGHLYGARTTPHMFVIDGEGVLRYEGAIDDNPRGRTDAPTNYVRAAVDSLLAGQAPEVTETEPYGCSVKYPDA